MPDVMPDVPLASYAAVVLAGGRGTRLDGVDKASVELDGRTFLARALDAVVDAAEVVVVGDQVPTDRPVTFCREDPRHGGPVAALLTGCDALLRRPGRLVVLAVDMPWLTDRTVRRLLEVAGRPGRDGAVLLGEGGRRQLALALDPGRLGAVRPGREEQHGMALAALLEPLDLVEVPAVGDEGRDVDTWADLRDLGDSGEG